MRLQGPPADIALSLWATHRSTAESTGLSPQPASRCGSLQRRTVRLAACFCFLQFATASSAGLSIPRSLVRVQHGPPGRGFAGGAGRSPRAVPTVAVRVQHGRWLTRVRPCPRRDHDDPRRRGPDGRAAHRRRRRRKKSKRLSQGRSCRPRRAESRRADARQQLTLLGSGPGSRARDACKDCVRRSICVACLVVVADEA